MKVVILCLGSLWYRDDRAGLKVCAELKKFLKHSSKVCIVDCEVGLERCIGLVIREKPTHLVIIDAVYAPELKPGEIAVVESIGDIERSLAEQLHTHKLPLGLVLQYLRVTCPELRQVVFVGIPARDLSICVPDEECVLSPETEKSVETCIEYVKRIVRELFERERE